METISVVGGGLGGLVAAIAAREAGLDVQLLEAKRELGGRARSTPPPYVANWGPHALYRDGKLWAWLRERGLTPACVKPPLRRALLMRWKGEVRRVPPMELIVGLARTRRKTAPHDRSFTDWASDIVGPESASALAHAAGVFTFDHDPGRLSAAFVQDRLVRVTSIPSPARFVVGGWSQLIATLERRARDLGVRIETSSPVDTLPEPPVVVAMAIGSAARLLGDAAISWTGTRTALLDLGIEARRNDPYVVSDLDTAGWVETYTYADPSLAPHGEHLVQAQIGLRPGESLEAGVSRIEEILDQAFAGWRARETWRRRAAVENETGALDLPGTTWRDRPAIDRGAGISLVGDMASAPGLLGEVSHASALAAIRTIAADVTSRLQPAFRRGS